MITKNNMQNTFIVANKRMRSCTIGDKKKKKYFNIKLQQGFQYDIR